MKLLIFLFLTLLFSCTPTKVNFSFLKKAKDLGSKNQGIDKILYQRAEDYLILFNNGSRHGPSNRDVSDKDLADILGNEIEACENICKTNDGLADLEVRRSCTSSKTINMGSLCSEYLNQIKCVCTNKVNQMVTRNITLSEKEIQARTKELEAVIWVSQ